MMKRPDVDFIEAPSPHVFSQAKVFHSFLFSTLPVERNAIQYVCAVQL